jgi:DNA-binding NtrC family response regulator
VLPLDPSVEYAWDVDVTITSGSTEEDLVRRDAVALVVAFHPDPDYLGRHVQLGSGSLTFGRDHPDADLALHLDRRMSRSHAEVIRLRGELVIRDLRSRNGTWVNGERVRHRSLRDGDIIRIGSLALVVRWLTTREALPQLQTVELLGCGPGHATLLRNIANYGPRSSVVLIEGKAGVGKGLIARALHETSERPGPFVTFDCGAVAPGVMHSELFGHAAGAFSGARSRRGGLIEQARGGTLFLDEIGDASPGLQSSLLRLLEEGEYRPVGTDRPILADVRVVAATNRDLDAAVRAEAFRFDLLTRLRRLWLRVPSLQDRIEDVPLLATHFARKHLGPSATLHRQLAFALLGYHWPGNVRELDAIVERAAVESSDDRLLRWSEGLIPDSAATDPSVPPSAPRDDSVAPSPRSAQKSRKPDPQELVALLKAKDGNVTHLAKDLGVARHTVYRWVKDAGIDLEDIR